jgi:hypothetical protein
MFRNGGLTCPGMLASHEPEYPDAGVVSILGIFYGGQDYETILQDELEP